MTCPECERVKDDPTIIGVIPLSDADREWAALRKRIHEEIFSKFGLPASYFSRRKE